MQHRTVVFGTLAMLTIVAFRLHSTGGQPTTDGHESEGNSNCSCNKAFGHQLDAMHRRIVELETNAWSPSNICRVCPSGFTHLPSVNGCYRMQLTNLNWSRAAVGCKSFHADAHLVIINNEREQTALAGFIDAHDSAAVKADCDRRESTGIRYFTAGQRFNPLDPVSPFVFRVINSEEESGSDCTFAISYTNYSSGEPNDKLGLEACINMYSRPGNFGWNDLPCNWLVCSICEFDMTV